MFPVGPHPVERLAHIGAVARGDKALQVERHFLPAHAHLDRAVRRGHSHRHEQLLDIELVAIRRGNRLLLKRARIDQLAEHLHVGAQAQVRMDVGALDHVSVGRCRASAVRRRIDMLVTLAQAGAQRQVRTAVAERNIFEAVERLARQAGAGQHVPVLGPAIEVDRRALGVACCWRWCCHGGCRRCCRWRCHWRRCGFRSKRLCAGYAGQRAHTAHHADHQRQYAPCAHRFGVDFNAWLHRVSR